MTQARYLVGDVIERLAELPADSVDLVLTSPPFLALRSYLDDDHDLKHLEGGSQSTPGEFIDWLLDVTEALDRVLAPHGSIMIELGDTYSGSGGAGGDYNADGLRAGQRKFSGSARKRDREGITDGGRPARSGRGDVWPLAKSLTMIPESYRWALTYGLNPFTGRETAPWRVRNVVRWVRPNPPIGALGDKFRPATSDLVVACKATDRYFDLDAVRTAHSEPGRKFRHHANVNPSQGWTADDETDGFEQNPNGAPPLDWWHHATPPYKGAHYATWPPALCVVPIESMCPRRVCRRCGEPSRRITKDTPELIAAKEAFKWKSGGLQKGLRKDKAKRIDVSGAKLTVGWSDCGHDDWRPGIVLDPFAGTGTTLAVATGHSRDAIGIDLNPDNVELALQRIGPLLLEVHT